MAPVTTCILCHINKCHTVVIVHWLVCSCNYIISRIHTKVQCLLFSLLYSQHLEQLWHTDEERK